MKKYWFEKKGLLILYLIIAPCMAITSVLFARATDPLLNGILLHDKGELQRVIFLFCLFAILDTVVFYLHKVIRENLRCAFLTGLKRDTIKGIMNMDYTEFRNNAPSFYISMVQRDIKRVNEDYFDGICGIYRVFTAACMTIVALFFYNPIICIVNLAIGACSVLLPRAFGKYIEKCADDAENKATEFQSALSDMLLGFNTIRLFSVVDRVRQQIDDRNKKNETSEKRRIVANFSVSYISMFLTIVGYILTLSIGAILAYQGKMTVGGVVAVSQLIGGVLVPFEELPQHFTNIKSVKGVKEKLLYFVNVKQQLADENVEELSDVNIKLTDIKVEYDEKVVLNEIRTEFEQNKKYIIMGESGSGKSTLTKAIAKMVPITKGQLTIGQQSIDQISEETLYRAINYMQQEVFLFDDSIYNNITLYKDYSSEAVNQVIEAVGLKEYVDGLKDGINTVINGNGYNLSGGQKQRIGIARSLLSGAKVIILDEITASLDMLIGKKIEDVVFGLKDVTVIWITHKITPDTMRKANRILVVKDGMVAEQGTYDELLDKKGIFYSYKMIAG